MLISLIGIAGVVWLFRARPVHMPPPLHLARARAARPPETEPAAAPFYRLEHELAGAFPPTVTDRRPSTPTRTSTCGSDSLPGWTWPGTGHPTTARTAGTATVQSLGDPRRRARHRRGSRGDRRASLPPVIDPAWMGGLAIRQRRGHGEGADRGSASDDRLPSCGGRVRGGRAAAIAVSLRSIAESPATGYLRLRTARVAGSSRRTAPSAEPGRHAVEPANGDDAAVAPSRRSPPRRRRTGGRRPPDRPGVVTDPVVPTPPAGPDRRQTARRDTEEVRAVAAALSRTGPTGASAAAGTGQPASRLRRPLSSRGVSALDSIFKAYDIRGNGPRSARRRPGPVGSASPSPPSPRATASWSPGTCDRPAPSCAPAFADGVTAAGVDVVDLGLASTDEMYFASGALDAPGAMFTASHNPAQYNGIKLCLAGARPVGQESGLARDQGVGGVGIRAAAGRPTRDREHTATCWRTSPPTSGRSSTVASCGRSRWWRTPPTGWAASSCPGSSTPCRSISRSSSGSSTAPSPTIRPTRSSRRTSWTCRPGSLETGADVGLAFDGDADRCFLVDDQGEPVSGSTTTAIVAAAMLDKHPGATILYNLICSKAVPEVIREHGGIPVRTRVGHSFIKAVMAETGAVFGGEHSGHYYFRDNYRADSGSIAALVVLEVLSKAAAAAVGAAQAVRALRRLRRDQHRGRRPDGRHRAVAATYEPERHPDATQDRIDGLTVDLGDWWFNLRPSNTEPLLRLNLEAAHRGAVPGPHRRGPRPHQGVAEQDRGARPEAARDPRLPRGQGPAAVLRRRGRPVQPAAEAPLRRERRHPDHADRRGRDGRRRRARTASWPRPTPTAIKPTFEPAG